MRPFADIPAVNILLRPLSKNRIFCRHPCTHCWGLCHYIWPLAEIPAVNLILRPLSLYWSFGDIPAVSLSNHCWDHCRYIFADIHAVGCQLTADASVTIYDLLKTFLLSAHFRPLSLYLTFCHPCCQLSTHIWGHCHNIGPFADIPAVNLLLRSL
jgi:hypothetical protein